MKWTAGLLLCWAFLPGLGFAQTFLPDSSRAPQSVPLQRPYDAPGIVPLSVLEKGKIGWIYSEPYGLQEVDEVHPLGYFGAPLVQKNLPWRSFSGVTQPSWLGVSTLARPIAHIPVWESPIPITAFQSVAGTPSGQWFGFQSGFAVHPRCFVSGSFHRANVKGMYTGQATTWDRAHITSQWSDSTGDWRIKGVFQRVAWNGKENGGVLSTEELDSVDSYQPNRALVETYWSHSTSQWVQNAWDVWVYHKRFFIQLDGHFDARGVQLETTGFDSISFLRQRIMGGISKGRWQASVGLTRAAHRIDTARAPQILWMPTASIQRRTPHSMLSSQVYVLDNLRPYWDVEWNAKQGKVFSHHGLSGKRHGASLTFPLSKNRGHFQVQSQIATHWSVPTGVGYLAPLQWDTAVFTGHVLAQWTQEFPITPKWGIHWKGTAQYTTHALHSPVPRWQYQAGFQGNYRFKTWKVDGRWKIWAEGWSAYYAPSYDPKTGLFVMQSGWNPEDRKLSSAKVVVRGCLEAQLQHAVVYLLLDNVTQGWGPGVVYEAPNQPMADGQVRWGIRWVLFN